MQYHHSPLPNISSPARFVSASAARPALCWDPPHFQSAASPRRRVAILYTFCLSLQRQSAPSTSARTVLCSRLPLAHASLHPPTRLTAPATPLRSPPSCTSNSLSSTERYSSTYCTRSASPGIQSPCSRPRPVPRPADPSQGGPFCCSTPALPTSAGPALRTFTRRAPVRLAIPHAVHPSPPYSRPHASAIEYSMIYASILASQTKSLTPPRVYTASTCHRGLSELSLTRLHFEQLQSLFNAPSEAHKAVVQSAYSSHSTSKCSLSFLVQVNPSHERRLRP